MFISFLFVQTRRKVLVIWGFLCEGGANQVCELAGFGEESSHEDQ